MTKDEALKLALEALERCVATCFAPYAHEQVMGKPEHFVNQTITAIKEALAQPEQKRPPNCGTGYCSCIECLFEQSEKESMKWSDYEPDGMHHNKPEQQQSVYCLNCEELSKQVKALKICLEVERGFREQEQPAQKPIGYFSVNNHGQWEENENEHGQPFYTSPPQRTWVELTDEQWQVIADTLDCVITRSQKNVIEARLKGKT
jgi:hypothetical protein